MSLETSFTKKSATAEQRKAPDMVARLAERRRNTPVSFADVHTQHQQGMRQIDARLSHAGHLFAVPHPSDMEQVGVPARESGPEPSTNERASGEYPIDRSRTRSDLRETPSRPSYEQINRDQQEHELRHENVTRRYTDIAMQVARDRSEIQMLQADRAALALRAHYDQRAANALAGVDYDIATRMQRSEELGREMRILGEELEALNTDEQEREEHRFQAQHERFQRGYVRPEMANTPANPHEINREFYVHLSQKAAGIEQQMTSLQQQARQVEERLAQLMQQQYALNQTSQQVGGFFKNLGRAAGGFFEKRKIQQETQQLLASLRVNGEQIDRLNLDWRKLQEQLPNELKSERFAG